MLGKNTNAEIEKYFNGWTEEQNRDEWRPNCEQEDSVRAVLHIQWINAKKIMRIKYILSHGSYRQTFRSCLPDIPEERNRIKRIKESMNQKKKMSLLKKGSNLQIERAQWVLGKNDEKLHPHEISEFQG